MLAIYALNLSLFHSIVKFSRMAFNTCGLFKPTGRWVQEIKAGLSNMIIRRMLNDHFQRISVYIQHDDILLSFQTLEKFQDNCFIGYKASLSSQTPDNFTDDSGFSPFNSPEAFMCSWSCISAEICFCMMYPLTE
uniref:hypothetical protein n=1 Tax=unclassified Erwinia TaxID=2622719 RepID=UPI00403E1171